MCVCIFGDQENKKGLTTMNDGLFPAFTKSLCYSVMGYVVKELKGGGGIKLNRWKNNDLGS